MTDLRFDWQDIVWGAPQLAVPVALAALILAALVVWNYYRRGAATWVRVTAACLKLIAIGLVALCLVEPMKQGTRPRPKANLLPIVVDTSQSMRITVPGESVSRMERIRNRFADDAAWVARLSQSFDVRRYRFDRRLENVDDFDELVADGTASSLTSAIETLSQRFDQRPVGGMLLFTDGNATDAMSTRSDWSDVGFPIYPVVPAASRVLPDLRITEVNVRQTDFESAPTTVVVSVIASGLGRRKVFVQLRQLDGKLVGEQMVEVGGDADTEVAAAKFRFRPEQGGVGFFIASVFDADDRKLVESGELDESVSRIGEATLINNRRIVSVNRDSGPYRVLYVAGRPNWEFKFLRRAMSSDAEIQLVGLVRIADKKPKFSFRDRGISDTNPLFAGLGDEEEEIASQYDEPVIRRFDVRESEELREGFPETDEELFAYHAVVLDDIETGFFSQDEMLRLRSFVSTRGGGLLLLGGTESFAANNFADTPLGELSPVYAPRSVSDSGLSNGRIKLTREGLVQPWMRLRETETDEANRLQSMPPFLTINPVGDVKPGASRLAVVGDRSTGSAATAIAVQRFGKGRTGAIPIGDLWRWSMRRAAKSSLPTTSGDSAQHDLGRDDPAQMWRQTMHWLVSEVPQRVELRIDKGDDASGPATLRVEARDESYLPLDNASVELTIRGTGGDELSLTAQADPSVAGLYVAQYWPRSPGGYVALAEVKAADGSPVGSDETGWTSQMNALEFARLDVNRQWLTQLAQQTGGQVIDEDALNEFADELPNRKIPVTETWVYPLWHQTWVMIAAITCLCGEWGLRRWKGLA